MGAQRLRHISRYVSRHISRHASVIVLAQRSRAFPPDRAVAGDCNGSVRDRENVTMSLIFMLRRNKKRPTFRGVPAEIRQHSKSGTTWRRLFKAPD